MVSEEHSQFKAKENILLHFYHTSPEQLFFQQLITSCSEDFLQEWIKKYSFNQLRKYNSEEEIFEEAKVKFIPPFLRENENIINSALLNQLPKVIQTTDITAIIHSHRKWSDGVNIIEEMAKAAVAKGLQFLVISDHSKSAFYANGLTEEE